MKKNGGVLYAEDRMKEFQEKAIKTISSFPDNHAKSSLLKLVDYVINRKK